MIYVDEPVGVFAKKHGIEIREMECLNCKKKFKPSIPFAVSGYRGIQVAEHGCPKRYNGYIVVPTSKKEKDFWINWRYE